MSFYDAIRVGASGAAGDFEIERSLRFNDDDSAYLSRSPSGSGNRKTFTYSCWFKRGNLGTQSGAFLKAGPSSSNYFKINIANDHKLYVLATLSGAYVEYFRSTRLFRDPGAWMHLVVRWDTTDSTAAQRVRVYINGSEIEGTRSSTPGLNLDGYVNYTDQHEIGASTVNSQYWDGYIAEATLIDGQTLPPSSFAETNSDTGQWNPIDTSGLTFGTNGFRLQFADNSGTTATTLGKDTSGNSNNFTPNNFSVSAGTGNDSVTDTPTNNFATLNILSFTNAGGTFANGNLDFTADSNYATRIGNFSLKTGKWYWEVIITNVGTDLHGIIQGSDPDGNAYPGYDTNGTAKGIGWYSGSGGLLYGSVPDGGTNGGTISAGDSALSTYTTNDVLGFASDIANGTLAFYKNGTLEYTLTGIGSHDWFPAVCGYGTSSTKTINFGQLKATSTAYADANGHGNFKYSVPSGFLALCSANLPDPAILLPNQHFEPKIYTPNSGNLSVTGYQFQPDWIWLKSRNQAYRHYLFDSVRGTGQKAISSNLNVAEGNDAGSLTSFDSTGWTTSGSSGFNDNGSGANGAISYAWNAGDTDSATYRVVVVSDSGNKYRFRNSANSATFAQSAVTLDLAEGGTYTFDGSDSTMASHPIKLSTTSDGTHGGGSSYNTGVTYELDGSTVTESAYVSGYSSATSRKLIITVAASAPTLYYYCHVHSGMGGQANTNSTLGSSNFDGTTQAVVKANTTAGFSIVTYTGTGSVATVGHGLGTAPKLVLTKSRSTTGDWGTLNVVADPTAESRIHLNDNGGYSSYQGYKLWNDTVPTSSVFTVREDAATNASSVTYVAYVFSIVEGFSSIGRYSGVGGNSNGNFVFTGFKPAFLIVKNFASEAWLMVDSARNPSNAVDRRLFPHNDGTDSSEIVVDFLSNGFKARNHGGAYIISGPSSNYLYWAFAETPFKFSRGV